jgi:hypothetical protein
MQAPDIILVEDGEIRNGLAIGWHMILDSRAGRHAHC